MDLNSRWATVALLRQRYRRNFCLPRYTPRRWWECDVFELTAAGYFREYEIKLTLADFRADAHKRQCGRDARGRRSVLQPPEEKHRLLARRVAHGPTRFWFVTPEGLVPRAELPEWAGLLELRDRGAGWQPHHRWGVLEVVRAPTLHRRACDPRVAEHARGVCYWRMHHLLLRPAEPGRD